MRCAAVLFCLLFAGEPAVADSASFAEAKAALASENVMHRFMAAARLGAIDDPRAGELLRQALKDPAAIVRASAATAIANHRRVAFDALVLLLRDEEDARVIRKAFEGLRKLGDPKGAASITPFLTHSAAIVRVQALEALSALSPEVGRSAALKVLQKPWGGDRAWTERARALLLLAKVAKPDEFFVIAELYRKGGGPEKWLARSCFARVIAGLKPTDAPHRLLQLMADEDARVSAAAGKAFFDLGESARAQLTSFLSHESARVRIGAIAGIYQGKLRSAAPALIARVRLDPDRDVRWAATQALWSFEVAEADEMVLDATRAKAAPIRVAAYRLLQDRLGADLGFELKPWRKALAAWRAKKK